MDKSAKSRNKVDPGVEPDAKRVVFCTGKVYYELDAEREAMGAEDDVKIVRIEQLSPFPWDLVDRELRRYPNAEVVWCQEEPMNIRRVVARLAEVPDAVQGGAAHQQAAGRVEVRGAGAGGVNRDGVRGGARGGAGWPGEGGFED